jgi:hypothetical protein
MSQLHDTSSEHVHVLATKPLDEDLHGAVGVPTAVSG